MSAPFRTRENGIDLFVRLTPKSSADRLEGVEISADGRSYLKARVRAVPENGAANAALERLIGKALGVPASTVSVVGGGTSRLKTLRVAGDPAVLALRVETLSGGSKIQRCGMYTLDLSEGQRPPLSCRLSSLAKPSNWLCVRNADRSSTPTRGEIGSFCVALNPPAAASDHRPSACSRSA